MLINLQTAKEGLSAVIKATPRDYVYPFLPSADGSGGHESCTYTRDDAPSCLIGKVMVEQIGVPLSALKTLDTDGAADLVKGVIVSSDGFRSVIRATGHEMTAAAEHYLRSAQCAQDCGHSWHLAYQRAERSFDFLPLSEVHLMDQKLVTS